MPSELSLLLLVAPLPLDFQFLQQCFLSWKILLFPPMMAGRMEKLRGENRKMVWSELEHAGEIFLSWQHLCRWGVASRLTCWDVL